MDYKAEESSSAGTQFDLETALKGMKWNDQGLMPAIAADHESNEVLMMAWMNRESLVETLTTGQVCYWSRSRQSFWRKGESSGHVQKLVSAKIDCDGDALLLKVDQKGAACHTYRRSCFYWTLSEQGLTCDVDPNSVKDPD